jgi:arylsulfatase A-like enzyme
MNVLLLAVDTLRADHLGCYGYGRPTSPTLDALAAEGVCCTNFMASAIPTYPSFTTLFTGQHAIRHGIVCQGGTQKLAEKTPTPAVLFLDKGYLTAAFDNLPNGRPWFGHGYEMIVDSSRRRGCGLMISCEEINRRLLPFLKSSADGGEPFFAFVHYWDPHTPYWAAPRYRSLFYAADAFAADKSLDPLYRHPLGRRWKDSWLAQVLRETGREPARLLRDPAYLEALYDQEIRCVDDGIAAVLETLETTRLADDTLVMVLADHGECMTEHGIYFDHHGLYAENLHVPLIARLPGRLAAGKVTDRLIQHQDVLPTLCEAAQLKTPSCDGKSAWGILTGEREDEVLADVLYSAECSWQKKWARRDRRFHFIRALEPDWYGNPEFELYDLEQDPRQTQNIASRRPDLVREFNQDLNGWIAGQLARCGRTADPVAASEITLLPVEDRPTRWPQERGT